MLLLRVAGVVALVAASVAAIADQSTRFVSGQEIVGVHEIPAFIAGRVELPPGLAPDDRAPGTSGVRRPRVSPTADQTRSPMLVDRPSG
jgi:hypothetical protein